MTWDQLASWLYGMPALAKADLIVAAFLVGWLLAHGLAKVR